MTGTTKNVCLYYHQMKDPIHVLHILVHVAVYLINLHVYFLVFVITSQPLPIIRNIP